MARLKTPSTHIGHSNRLFHTDKTSHERIYNSSPLNGGLTFIDIMFSKSTFIASVFIAASAVCASAGGDDAPKRFKSYTPRVSNEYLMQIKETKKYTDLWGERATMFNTEGCDTTSIVMFGNSLTQGGDWANILDNPNVLNRGIIGDIVQGLADRIDNVVDGHPKKIFLLIGVNDVSHDLSADSISTAIGGLIDLINSRSPQTKVYVQSLLPINNSFGRYKRMIDKEQVVRNINTRLRPIALAKGARWIELYPTFCDGDMNLRADWTSDGLHLRPEGYKAWAIAIKPYINE